MRLLVTGAGGFVGTQLVRACQRRSWAVVGCGRGPRPAHLGELAGWHACDLAAPEPDFRAALADLDAVVHLAALVHDTAGNAAQAHYEAVNVAGTRALASQACIAGAGQFVFLSSTKVYGDPVTVAAGNQDLLVDESRAPAPAGLYGRTKLAAEQVLADIAGAMPVTVLRPPLVYGPGVGANFLSLLRAVDRGWPLPLAAVRNRRSYIYVGNLCEAICRAIECRSAASGTFVLADEPPLSTPGLVRALAQALGRRPRLFGIPPRTLLRLGALSGRGEQVRRLCESLVVDPSAFRHATGWQPVADLPEALRRTVEWYRGGSAV